MPSETIKGSCLCKTVTFEITLPISRFYYCHCGRCRKATGSAHAANLWVPVEQFKWISGEDSIQHYSLPEAKTFGMSFCRNCGTRSPRNLKARNAFLIPAGLLDQDPSTQPQASIFWDSRAPWYLEPNAMQKHPENAPPS